MSPKQDKAVVVPTNVVDLVSSSSSDDDEVEEAPLQQLSPNNLPSPPTISPPPSVGPTPQNQQPTGSRSFWKAGDYDVGPSSNFASSSQGHLEHSRVHPKFLHSNATSHKWAFGAIAELLDNAVDEICNGATFVKVDKVDLVKDNSPALLFQDDGGGMDPNGLRKCMSLGYSSKKTNTTIGQYGNGFKTSTMRLGPDVIVFTRAIRARKATQSIGLLSYNFLRKTAQDDVIVPMVDFDVSNQWAEPIIYGSQDDWTSNLETILEWSPFASKEELMLQFEDIGPHGTKIIIYNLWLNDEGIYELNFDADDEDIRLRDEANCGGMSKPRQKLIDIQSHISYRIRYSLRAYASVLYLRKFSNFNIILRGKPVEQYNIADEFKHRKIVIYKPQLSTAVKEVSVETKIGFIKEAPNLPLSGFNVYHKNRLIRPFWKVKTDGDVRGNGVFGVLEANYIEPAHDKQDFERSSLFIRLESKLKQMLMEYWNQHCHLVGYQAPGVRKSKEMTAKHPVGLASNIQKQFPGGQQNIGLSADIQDDMNLYQPILLTATGKDSNNGQLQSGSRVSIQTQSPTDAAITRHAAGFVNEEASVDGPVFTSVDQICDDNIQLFMRCEEHKGKESELKKTIEELERELELAKKKCAQLSAHMEKQKQQTMLLKHTKHI